MRAVVVTEPGGPDSLVIAEVPDPRPGPREVIVDVAATAVNRADLLQRRGHYTPPPGASDIIGLECSGTVAELGDEVTEWHVGDEVCALLAGGGYADKVAVPVGQLMPLPGGLSLVESASLPELACTVWSNVFMVAGLRQGETILVHGGAGGIGTIAIQLAKTFGAYVATTVGSAGKAEIVRALGADTVIDYREQDFVAEVNALGGADVILDNMGAKYLSRNVDALAMEGRLVVIGLQGGVKGELDIAGLMSKQAAIIGTLLRPRPTQDKATICAAVVEHVWPLVAEGKVRPVIHATFPLTDAAAAHRAMEDGTHVGKILLTA